MLGVSPTPAYGHALLGNNLQGNIRFAYVVNVGWFQPTFLVVLSLLRSVQQINRGACKEKEFMEC